MQAGAATRSATWKYVIRKFMAPTVLSQKHHRAVPRGMGRCSGMLGPGQTLSGSRRPLDRSAQFREVSNIDHYVRFRTCKTNLHRRPCLWLLPVTESAARSRPTQASIMPPTRPDPLFSVADIGVFPCAKCGKPIRLSSIEPTEPGFDVRTSNARSAITP